MTRVKSLATGILSRFSTWHLAPAGHTTCDFGSPAPQNDCAAAVTGQINSGQQVGSGGTCNDGSWGSVPLGCSAQIGTGTPHFKTSGVNCNTGYQLVCSGGFKILGVVRYVRVELEGTNHLNMREVKVFDTSGVNRALSMTATQSSTLQGYPASNVVNGNLGDFSHTNNDAGMYHELTNSNLIVYTIMSF
jgi:hypothetical protein